MKPASVYVHFPWCLAKCPYCDFTSYAAKPETIPHDRYADAVIHELRARVGRETTLEEIFLDLVAENADTPTAALAAEIAA